MAEELELKAVIPDPDLLRTRLLGAGAVARFRGRMSDRRYDRAGELAARDEVLRVRSFQAAEGLGSTVLGWKGPVTRTPEGYKRRTELELPLAAPDSGPTAGALLAALGYEVVHAIDREVEVLELAEATVRLEQYPDMDPLVEVEGVPRAIEQAIAVSGIAREAFTAESLTEFVRRFEARTGRPARLAEP
jgi:adenylate cyclase class IV